MSLRRWSGGVGRKDEGKVGVQLIRCGQLEGPGGEESTRRRCVVSKAKSGRSVVRRARVRISRRSVRSDECRDDGDGRSAAAAERRVE